MSLPQKPVKRHSRLLLALLLSLGAHLLVLPWIAKDAIFHIPAKARRTLVGLVAQPSGAVQHAQQGMPSNTPSTGHSVPPDLTPALPPAIAEAEKEKPPEKISGQVVSLGQPQDERPPDKPTHYLSEHDSRVLKESRAKETSAFYKNTLSKVQKEGKDARQAPKKAAAAPSSVRTGENGGSLARDGQVKGEMPKQARQDSRTSSRPAVRAGQNWKTRLKILGLRKDRSVELVEPARDFSRQLDVRHLVLADRHDLAAHHQDVGGLEHGIVEQTQ